MTAVMTNMEMGLKLDALLQDEAFNEIVLKANSMKEIVEILNENGITATEEELRACGEEGMEILKQEGYITDDGELSAEVLENVVGGKWGGKVMAAGGIMIGVALLSDFVAGAFAVALVSHPVGWFIGGVALVVYGAYLVGKKR